MVRELGVQTRLATAQPAKIDEATREVEVVFTTGARVLRFAFLRGRIEEELEVSANAVRMERLNAGAPLLNAHDGFDLAGQIGVVVRAWLTNGQGHAVVRFSERAEVEPIWRDVAAGIIRNVSVGYLVHRYIIEEREGQPDLYRAVDWEPVEVSLVPVPADPGAGIRGGGQQVPCAFVKARSFTTEETMSDQHTLTTEAGAPAAPDSAEIERRQTIRDLTSRVGLPGDFADGLIDRNIAVDQARVAIIDELAERQGRAPEIVTRSGFEVGLSYDDPAVRIGAMSEALVARMGGRAPANDQARQYMGISLLGMAGELLAARGVRTRGLSRDRLLDAALNTRSPGHTISDFPQLLAATGRRQLLGAHQMASSPLRTMIARPALSQDFRPISRLRRGEAPKLEKVNESGEVTSGTVGEERQAYQIDSYAKIFTLTRQALFNDDLQAFADFNTAFGQAAAEAEATVLVALLTANSGNGATLDDGKALYHADHGNKAGTGAAIDLTTLSDARQAMREQKGIDGVTPIAAPPRYLLIGPAKETEAEKFLAQLSPTAPADVNPFAGRLEVLVEPRLSSNAWRLFADPDVLPVLEYAYLADAPGPQLAEREGWATLGVEFRAVLDFGAGVIDWRGTYLNPGN